MEHFQVKIRIDALKSHIVNILLEMVPYIKQELVYNDFLDEDDEKLQEIEEYLNQYETYVKAKLSSIYKKSDIKRDIINGLECPNCGNETIVIDGDSEAFCHFCEKRFINFDEEYISANYNLHSIIMDGGTDPRYECVECEFDSMIFVELANSYICLTCGCSYSEKGVAFCVWCENNLAINKYPDELVFCDYCIEDFKSQ